VAYRLTVAARRDLAEIWAYIANDNEPAADRFIAALKEHCEMLGRNPRAGRRRDEVQTGLRSFPYGEHLILYRVATPGVQIVRVVHGRRDLSRLLH
jgi:toxin ParE1/3/4